MTDRYLLVRKDGQPAQIPAGDAVKLRGALNEAPRATAESGSGLSLASIPANTVVLTGPTNLSTLGILPDGTLRRVIMGSPAPGEVVSNSNLLLFGGSISASVGDSALFLSQGAGVWKCLEYTRADGTSVTPFRGGKLTKALDYATPVSIPAEGNTYIGDVDSTVINITGSTAIGGFGSGYTAGVFRELVFAQSLTLTHSDPGIVLPGKAAIITAAGDRAGFVNMGGNRWVCMWYTRADGTALVSSGSASTYTFTQSTALATWTIAHNLNRRPSVTVVDTLESVVVPDVSYVDANTIQINFGAAFAGKAYLN